MRLDRSLTIRFAVIALVGLLIVGYLVALPRGPVLVDASVGSAQITPNADGVSDATTIHYRIRSESLLSIYLQSSDDQKYYFRHDEARSPGIYDVEFSGIVQPFTIPDETVKGDILQRLIPNGEYTWVIEATSRITGRVDSASGRLTVTEADTQLPDIWEFSVSPTVFTPNQDGLDDRVWINVFVPKPADLRVYLINSEGRKIFIPEFQSESQPGGEGRHSFEYDGGIDNGSDPPPDGTYQVQVESSDAEGQKLVSISNVTIQNGGVPLAEIVAQPVGDTVRFSSETVLVGDVLTFELTVENYGDAPIRTTGPDSGYVYDQDALYSTTGFYQESGAWRVGINCDTCLTDYPWRWALGSPATLTPIETKNGIAHYYLMPGERAVVTGGIRLKNIVDSRNPQEFWAGLIHEDVGIAPLDNRVDPHWIEIVAGLTGF